LKSRTSIVIALGTAQTLAWASSFYLPAMLAAPMARDLGLAPSSIYALLSISLIMAALLSPWAGRRIDASGGRRVLLASRGLFVLALLLTATAQGLVVPLASCWVAPQRRCLLSCCVAWATACLLTIVRGTLPLALFAAQGYGARQGWIALPGRLVGAFSPWLLGLVLERWGVATLWLTGVLGLGALATLSLLRLPAAAPLRATVKA